LYYKDIKKRKKRFINLKKAAEMTNINLLNLMNEIPHCVRNDRSFLSALGEEAAIRGKLLSFNQSESANRQFFPQ
jgi:hypothetical protein